MPSGAVAPGWVLPTCGFGHHQVAASPRARGSAVAAVPIKGSTSSRMAAIYLVPGYSGDEGCLRGGRRERDDPSRARVPGRAWSRGGTGDHLHRLAGDRRGGGPRRGRAPRRRGRGDVLDRYRYRDRREQGAGGTGGVGVGAV